MDGSGTCPLTLLPFSISDFTASFENTLLAAIISATRVQNVGHKSMGISFFERINILVSKIYAMVHQMLWVIKC